MSTPPFDWNRYLTYAQTLLSAGTSETTCRIATSRAYYAAYWKARQLLEKNGAVFPQKRSHEFCWRSFSAVYNKDGEQIGRLGSALKVRRVHADYEDTPPLSQKGAISDVQDAADLIDALSNLTEADKQTAVRRANQISPEFS